MRRPLGVWNDVHFIFDAFILFFTRLCKRTIKGSFAAFPLFNRANSMLSGLEDICVSSFHVQCNP